MTGLLFAFEVVAPGAFAEALAAVAAFAPPDVAEDAGEADAL